MNENQRFKAVIFNLKKAEWVEKILRQFGVRPEEAIAIGDSAGDIGMFQKIGFSIAFCSSCQDLDQIASLCVQTGDLGDIIKKLPLSPHPSPLPRGERAG